jgi:glutamate N-acetyltransferase/amino-acid N-acetyltransferase
MLSYQTFQGLTFPKGFRVATAFAGIKSKGLDMLLLVADKPVFTTAMFTTNQAKAASIILGQAMLQRTKGLSQAILVNSGNANSATGEQGMNDTLKLIACVAQELELSSEMVVTSSTGIIGEFLPMEPMTDAIVQMAQALSDEDTGSAEAILTTDLRTKAYSVSLDLAGHEVRISGIAKGSGMIHPNMATMLSYVTTDVVMEPFVLDAIFKDCVHKSFHMMTVDGDQSTNDTVLLMNSALADNAPIDDILSEDAQSFQTALLLLMQKLAKDIVRDGEGASKFIEVQVKGAVSEDDAYLVASKIAQSSLVKIAMFGEDPNWGRIVAAAGSAGVSFDLTKVKITLQGQLVFDWENILLSNKADKAEMDRLMKEKEIQILFDLGQGTQSATMWTCDLSYDYVKINAEYHT